ncbi:MAG: ABC transporter ATP-binding protein [Sneathiellaceae bacterium]
MALFELESIRKTYHTGEIALDVLKGISFAVDKGEMVSIMGQSGSGKSTLMNIIGLLDKPSAGTYRIQGRTVAELGPNDMARIRNRSIGFVFQSYHLLKKVTAQENVGLPLFYRQAPRREMMVRALAALEKVDMAERAHHRPSEMSGGQAQRVAIARAIVGDPELLLADEPTGALDTRVGDEILTLFRQLNREQGLTVVIITHDPAVAQACDRRLVVRDGLLVDDEGEFQHRQAAAAAGG